MAANLQSMCQYWRNFDLQELQKELDTTATDLASRQDDSDVSRKRLVEQSRDFKKNTSEDVRKVVAPLLKSFQSEIDALSKRSKAAEAAFLAVYKKLIDVPDPVQVLEYSLGLQKKVQRAQDLEIENKQLRETLEEYNNEFAEVKNQEVTIKTLKDKLKDYEDRMEATAQTRAKEKERELQRQFTEKERLLQEAQMSMAKKLGEAEHKVATLQSSLENTQSELFDLRAKYDEATSAKSDEMEILMADLERANERAAAAEREAEQLRNYLASANQNLQQAEQMQKAPDMEQAIDILKRSSLEVELAAKEKEIAQLVEDVQRLQSTVTKLRDTGSSQVAKLEEELSTKNRAFKVLEEKLLTQEDYEEIKRELSTLKSIEFSNTSEDTEDDSKGKSLEMLLLEKNRTLQTENTQLKVSNADLTGCTSPAPSGLPASQPITNTEAFATLLGEEIVQSYQLEHNDTNSRCNTPTTVTPPSSSTPVSSITSTTPISVSTTTSTTTNVAVSSQATVPSSPALQMGSPRLYQNGPIPPEVMDGMAFQRLHTIARSESSNAQVLDTADVSQKIREILSTHNIGQRLFAKHVLGLSQGTVSELLSKPKHWDKLTEKGRESYRKMYAWASVENNILALKAISPKKGSAPLMSSYKHEDSATEERIARILNEAQQQMHAKHSQEKAQVASVASIYQHELAKMAHQQSLQSPPPGAMQPMNLTNSPGSRAGSVCSSSGGGESRGRRGQTDSNHLPSDIVTRIYREELMKLANAAQKSGNLAESAQYQQELARLASNSYLQDRRLKPDLNGTDLILMNGRKEEDMRSNCVTPKVKREPLGTPEQSAPLDYSMMNGHSHQRSSSHTPNHNDDSNLSQEHLRHAGSAFFLVRPRSNGHANYDNPLFSPPLVPTDSMSPLQRMQNIANSLVSKTSVPPHIQKPLKAVLPPISQEQFDRYSNLNTDDVVKQVKDTLSQFSISQRLFGESILGLSQGSVSDLLARPKPWHMLTQKGREPFIRMQIFLEDTEAIPKLVASQYRIQPDKLMRTGPHGGYSPPESPHEHIQPPSSNSSLVSSSDTQERNKASTPLNTTSPNNGSSVYEIAAMTTELETLDITSRVKEVLQFHNLGQKLFGEAVLGLSQGSVSELLSKPKPWHMLSLKGREPFIKMQMWLTDPLNVEKLRAYQSEQKAAKKRKNSTEEREGVVPKKPRVFFTEDQKEALKLAYAQDPYPNQTTIEFLAGELGVNSKTVVNWFHNHRMRAKQQHHSSSNSGTPTALNPVKAEHSDDVSDHSDSVCSDSGHFRTVLSTETSQWLFPSFEPVRENGSRRESINSAVSDASSTTNMNGVKYKTEDKSDTESLTNEQTVCVRPLTAISVNKRKSAKPQRVCESSQLELVHRSILEQSETSQESNAPSSQGISSSGSPVVPDSTESLSDQKGKPKHLDKIQKIQKAIQSSDLDWDEVDRKENISRLENSIVNHADADWEF